MSTFATILATAAVTAGALAVSRRIASRWNEAKDIVRRMQEARASAAAGHGARPSPYAGPGVIDFEKDPLTGSYHAPHGEPRQEA